VNKEVGSEARAASLSNNEFCFSVSGFRHPIWLPSSPLVEKPIVVSEVLGPFSLAHRQHFVRDMKHICLVLNIDDSTSEMVVERHRARLSHFVEPINLHADYVSKKNMLRSSTVEVAWYCQDVRSDEPADMYHPHLDGGWVPKSGSVDTYMFALESLVEFRRIPELTVSVVAPWFALCLELCIRGEGEGIKKIQWPVYDELFLQGIVGLRKAGPSTVKVLTSARMYYQPLLDWREFAKRKGVEIPDDVSIARFWKVRERYLQYHAYRLNCHYY
jgi:hypothetical protein